MREIEWTENSEKQDSSRGNFFLGRSFSSKSFSPHVKTSCAPAENVYKTPEFFIVFR